MSTKHTRDMDDRIQTMAERAVLKEGTYKQSGWANVPKAARPYRDRSAKSTFLRHRYRRKGYLLEMDVQDLAKVCPCDVDAATWETLEEHWLRGNYWPPLRIVVEWSRKGWQLVNLEDKPTATFLATKGGDPRVWVQALEVDDPPAREDRLDAFVAFGLRDAHRRVVEVLSAEVTL